MARRPSFLGIVAILDIIWNTSGLQVTPGSPCSALCLDSDEGDTFSPDSSHTNSSEIVCEDSQYEGSRKGTKYRECVECLAQSAKANGTESDLQWLLYNSRFAITSCLFDFPAEIANRSTDTSCLTEDSCQSLRTPLVDDDLDPIAQGFYSYCTAHNSSFFGRHLRPCLDCLRSSNDQVYLANFMILLTGGCAYKPIGHNDIFGIVGDIFSKEEIGISPPKTGSDPVNTTSTIPPHTAKKEKSLSVGIIGGIAGGVGFIFLLAIALFVMHYFQESRFRRQQFQKLLEEQKRYMVGNAIDLDEYHQQPQTTGGVFVDSDFGSRSTSQSSNEYEIGKATSGLEAHGQSRAPTRTAFQLEVASQEMLARPAPVHRGYASSTKAAQLQAIDHILSPPASVRTFHSYRMPATMTPSSLRTPMASPAWSTGKIRRKNRKIRQLRQRSNTENIVDLDDDVQSTVTGPASTIGGKERARFRDLPLRVQLGIQSRNQVEEKLRHVQLPAKEELPLASGKSLLYGW